MRLASATNGSLSWRFSHSVEDGLRRRALLTRTARGRAPEPRLPLLRAIKKTRIPGCRGTFASVGDCDSLRPAMLWLVGQAVRVHGWTLAVARASVCAL